MRTLGKRGQRYGSLAESPSSTWSKRTAAIKELILKYRKAGKSSANFADLDLVGYSKDTKKINKLFLEKYLFQKDKIINALFGDRRRIYYQPEGTYHVDIFLDKLEFNHDIDIPGRLEMDFPDLNVADLLLTKLQIHYINDKDLLDMMRYQRLTSGRPRLTCNELRQSWRTIGDPITMPLVT